MSRRGRRRSAAPSPARGIERPELTAEEQDSVRVAALRCVLAHLDEAEEMRIARTVLGAKRC